MIKNEKFQIKSTYINDKYNLIKEKSFENNDYTNGKMHDSFNNRIIENK